MRASSSSHSASGPSQHKQGRGQERSRDQHQQLGRLSRLPRVCQLEKTSAQKNRQIRQCYPGMCKHQKVLFTLKRKLYRTRLNILFSSYLDGEVQISRLYLPESQIGQHSPIQSHRGRKYFRRDRGGPQIPRR